LQVLGTIESLISPNKTRSVVVVLLDCSVRPAIPWLPQAQRGYCYLQTKVLSQCLPPRSTHRVLLYRAQTITFVSSSQHPKIFVTSNKQANKVDWSTKSNNQVYIKWKLATKSPTLLRVNRTVLNKSHSNHSDSGAHSSECLGHFAASRFGC
jgi:hypothetical protein